MSVIAKIKILNFKINVIQYIVIVIMFLFIDVMVRVSISMTPSIIELQF